MIERALSDLPSRIHAEPSADLLARVRSGARRRRTRSLGLIAGSAAVAVSAAGVGLAITSSSGGGAVESVVAAPASTPDMARGGAGSTPPGGSARMPEAYFFATETALVRQSTDGSSSSTLAQYEGLFKGSGGEPSGSQLVTFDVSPDGRFAYADVCCEPAAGRIERIATTGTGGRPEKSFASFRSPAVSADGTTLAGVGGTGNLVLMNTQTGDASVVSPPRDNEPVRQDSFAWSPDGKLLAMLQSAPSEEVVPTNPANVAVVSLASPHWDASEFDPPDGQTYAGPAFRSDGMLVVARQPVDPSSPEQAVGVVLDPRDGTVLNEFSLNGRVVDQDYDRTGTYLLTTYTDGTVAWQGAGDEGTLAADGAVASAW